MAPGADPVIEVAPVEATPEDEAAAPTAGDCRSPLDLVAAQTDLSTLGSAVSAVRLSTAPC